MKEDVSFLLEEECSFDGECGEYHPNYEHNPIFKSLIEDELDYEKEWDKKEASE